MYGVQFQCKLFQQWIKISLTATLIGSSVKMDTTMTMDEIRKMISGEHRKTSVQIEEPTWNLDDWDDGEEEDNSKVLLWFVLMWFLWHTWQFPSPPGCRVSPASWPEHTTSLVPWLPTWYLPWLLLSKWGPCNVNVECANKLIIAQIYQSDIA